MYLFVSAEGCLPKILCETLISVLPKVSPAKNMLAASSIRCIKVWWLIVSWLSPKLGTIQFVSSSSSVMPEVFDSIKLGCSFFCSFSDTITASSIKVGLNDRQFSCSFHIFIVFNWLIKSDKRKSQEVYFFAFTNIPLSFLIPLSMDVVTSRMVIITSCALS